MNFLDKWNKAKFNVYDSEEKTVLKLITNLSNFIGELTGEVDKKTDNNGDHKGSWQGINRPTLSEEGMRGTVEKLSGDLVITNTNVETNKNNINTLNLKVAQGNVITVAKNGEFNNITSAINKAIELGCSKLNRYIIKISEGVYNEQIVIPNGIDLIGTNNLNCIITFSGTGKRTGDTLKINGDCSIKNITVIQDNKINIDNQNYCIHMDGIANIFTAVLENVKCFSKGEYSHHAMGVGLFGNQALYIKNCEFQSNNKSAFYFHNSENQLNITYCEIDNSKFYGCMVNNLDVSNPRCAMLFEDINSNQTDEVKITNSELWSYDGTEIVLQQHKLFTGARNTLYVSLKNTKYSTLSYSEGGTIIDLDRAIQTNLTGNIKGNPLILDTSYNKTGSVIGAKLCDTDSSDLFIGVAVPYCGVIFAVNKGIVPVIAVNVTTGGKLVTKADNSSTTGTNNVFGIALDNVGSNHSLINCALL